LRVSRSLALANVYPAALARNQAFVRRAAAPRAGKGVPMHRPGALAGNFPLLPGTGGRKTSPDQSHLAPDRIIDFTIWP
jgi:energy-converting hydrogenase Eha subunit F